MSYLKAMVLVTLALGSCTGYPRDSGSGLNARIVREFLGEFNAQDAAGMSALVTDDIKWRSINGDSLSLELEGKTALVVAMNEYFVSCPTCRSEIQSLIASNGRVSALEVASWMSNDGANSQQAVSVYEFRGSLIQGVYYFPSEPLPNNPNPISGNL